ncbi:Cof-type HAD-IIB family hydrolase [Calidifontibacillus erzurumensis]|uniref:Cof-type HAD-IIB family hydrolase n=1 Tax=Calidifontibacillus erzurumensis TaxID=2741433 RepID=UPI0035B546CF
MIYRLLAINIDGTLLKSNGKLSRETKEAIEYVRNKDVYITLVTSRNFPSAKKVAKALKLDSYLITHSGAFIAKTLDEPLFESRFSEEKTFNIVQVLETYNCSIRLVHERFSIGNRVKQKGNLMGKIIANSNDPLFYPIQFVQSLSDQLVDFPVAAPKIEVYFSTKEEMLEVKDIISKSFPEVNIVEAYDVMFEITPGVASKEQGLRRLSDHLGIALEETVVIADSMSDIPMIAAAGLGVAMWNSPFEVKKAADWVTRSNDHDGVAYMIKEHFRKQQRIEFLRKITKQ